MLTGGRTIAHLCVSQLACAAALSVVRLQ